MDNTLTTIILEVTTSLIFLIEARLEKYVISMKSPYVANYSDNNKKEHQWSFIYAAVIVLGYTTISGLWILLPSIFLSRRIFFDYSLKLFRNKQFEDIEGDQFYDRLARKIFGNKGGWKEALVIISIKTLYLWFLFQQDIIHSPKQ